MQTQSERTNTKYKPKFLRLLNLKRKRETKHDLEFTVDSEYLVHVLPRGQVF